MASSVRSGAENRPAVAAPPRGCRARGPESARRLSALRSAAESARLCPSVSSELMQRPTPPAPPPPTRPVPRPPTAPRLLCPAEECQVPTPLTGAGSRGDWQTLGPRRRPWHSHRQQSVPDSMTVAETGSPSSRLHGFCYSRVPEHLDGGRGAALARGPGEEATGHPPGACSREDVRFLSSSRPRPAPQPLGSWKQSLPSHEASLGGQPGSLSHHWAGVAV